MSSQDTIVNNYSTVSDSLSNNPTIHVCQPASQTHHEVPQTASQPADQAPRSAHSSYVRRTHTFFRRHNKMQPNQKDQSRNMTDKSDVSNQVLYSYTDFSKTFIAIMVIIFDIGFLSAFYTKTTQTELPKENMFVFVFLYVLYKNIMYQARKPDVNNSVRSTSSLEHYGQSFSSFPVCVIFHVIWAFGIWFGYMVVFSLVQLMPSPFNYVTVLAFIACT